MASSTLSWMKEQTIPFPRSVFDKDQYRAVVR
jgi:hypothetical protein